YVLACASDPGSERDRSSVNQLSSAMLRSSPVLACSAEHKCSWPDHLLPNQTSGNVAIFTYSELHSPANDSYFYDHHQPDDRYVCTADVKEVRPAWGRTDDGSLLKIVNTKAFPQKIRMEVCRSAGEPCTFLAKVVRSSCRQRYSIHKMAAVDPRDPDGGVFLAAFKVPSGCFCHVRQGSTSFAGTSEDTPSASPLVQGPSDLLIAGDTFTSLNEGDIGQTEDITFMTPESFSGQTSSVIGSGVQTTQVTTHQQRQFSLPIEQNQNLASMTKNQNSSITVSQNSADKFISSPQNSADNFVFSSQNTEDNVGSSAQNSLNHFGSSSQNSPDSFVSSSQNSADNFGSSSQNSADNFVTSSQNSADNFGSSSQNSADNFITSSQNSADRFVSSSQNSADRFVSSSQNSADNFVTSSQNSADNFGSSSQNSADNFITSSQNSADRFVSSSQNSADNFGSSSQNSADNFVTTSQNSADNFGSSSQNSADNFGSSSQNSADNFVTTSQNSADNFGSSSQNSADTFKSSVPFTTLNPQTSSFNPHPITTISPKPSLPPNKVISTFEQDFTPINSETSKNLNFTSVTSDPSETLTFAPITSERNETFFDLSDSNQQSLSEQTLSGEESKLHTVPDTFITTPFDLSPLHKHQTDGNYILSLRRVMDDGTEQPLDVVISVDGRLMGAVSHPSQTQSPVTLQSLSNDQALNLGLLFNELDQQSDVLRDKRHMTVHMNDSTVSLPAFLRNLSKSLENTTDLKDRGNMEMRPYVAIDSKDTDHNRTSASSVVQMTRNSGSPAPSSEDAGASFMPQSLPLTSLPSSTVSPSLHLNSEPPNFLDKKVLLIPSSTDKAIGNPLSYYHGPSQISQSRPISINLTRKRTQSSLLPNLPIQNASSALENITLSMPEILRMMRTGHLKPRNLKERPQQSFNWHPALLSTHLYATQPQVIQNYYIQVPEGNQGLNKETENEPWRPEIRPLYQRPREVHEVDDSVTNHLKETTEGSGFAQEQLQEYTPNSGSQEIREDQTNRKDRSDLGLEFDQTPSLMMSSPLLQHLSSFATSSVKVPILSPSVESSSSPTPSSSSPMPLIPAEGQHSKYLDFLGITTFAPEVTISKSQEGSVERDDASLFTSRTPRDTTSLSPDQVLSPNPLELDNSSVNFETFEQETRFGNNEIQVTRLNKADNESSFKSNISSLESITSSLKLPLNSNLSEEEKTHSKNISHVNDQDFRRPPVMTEHLEPRREDFITSKGRRRNNVKTQKPNNDKQEPGNRTESASLLPHPTSTKRLSVRDKPPAKGKTRNDIPYSNRTSLRTRQDAAEEVASPGGISDGSLNTRSPSQPPTGTPSAPLAKIPRQMLITEALDYPELLFSSQRVSPEEE
ncbi:uncharacterized protein LOC122244941, partial [Penaeus japonicus]|uniref:uncharacterized protein LOC122244941 n=1 Tax=Penaeus japonicus TaxID=27405 RepID=UPI001C711657